jgi:hypothetical protein
MNHRLRRIVLVPVLVLLLGVVFLALLSESGSQAALAQAGTGIVRVATTGTDGAACGSAATPCRTIQHAVHEAAEGEEIRIAAGTYTGTQQIWALGAGQMTTMTQVVIISKSLTLRGGHTTADWNTSVPAQNVTIIDAEGYGRGLTIVGNGVQTVTVEGLTVTGGDYTGLGNSYAPGQCTTTNGDCGGGIYAYGVLALIRQLVISDNVASASSSSSFGGGLYLRETAGGSVVEDTTFGNNESLGTNSLGGGMAVRDGSDLTVSGCTFVGNMAADNGGGLDSGLELGEMLVLEASDFISNSVLRTANGRGGAVHINRGGAHIRMSTFISNTGRNGGALSTQPGAPQEILIDGNFFAGNWSSSAAGAIHVLQGSVATLTNNILARNECGEVGDAIVVDDGIHAVLSHNTIVGEPSRTDGEAIFVRIDGTTVQLWNNIIVSHTYGIRTNSGVTATADHTLFYGNGQNAFQPAGLISSTNEITGQAPGFVDPAGFDYHVITTSPAIDAGVDAGVARDIDGDPRPIGGGYDIGADEVWTVVLSQIAFLPLVLR